MAYVDFGYGEAMDKEISRDGEALAQGMGTLENLLEKQYDDQALNAAILSVNPKWEDNHSGYSFATVKDVACKLLEHGWKSVDDIPTDHPLHSRVRS